MKQPRPTEEELIALYSKFPNLQLHTADGADKFVNMYLAAFEIRYDDKELDEGLIDDHIREVWSWYETKYLKKK